MRNTNLFKSSLLLVILLFCFGLTNVYGQLTLPDGGNYTQNFDGIGSGLPTGWSVRTGTSASSNGSTATLNTAKIQWSDSGGAYKNFASADGLSSGSNSTAQSNSTDRSLGLRQTGSFAVNGAAFVLQLSNTTEKTNFHLSFKLQSLDVGSTRTATWRVEYGVGSSPASFTSITTSPTTITTGGSAFSNTNVTVTLPAAIENQTGNVWIRISTLGDPPSSGNRPSTGIDDVVLTWDENSSSDPDITVSSASLNPFTYIEGNGPSDDQTFTSSATNLDGNPVTATAPTGYEISLTGSEDFASSKEISYTDGAFTNQAIYVRLAAGLTVNSYNGNVSISGGGDSSAATKAVSGSVTPAPNEPVVTGNENLTGTVGVAFNYQIIATENPYLYEISSDVLPAGLSLNDETGIISGTPTTADEYIFGVTATNATGTSDEATFIINVEKGTQTATLPNINASDTDPDITLPAATTQGIGINYLSDNTSVANVTGNTLSIEGIGTATITASNAGNSNYNSFNTTFTVTVSHIYSGTGNFIKITSIDDLTNGYYVITSEADAFLMTRNRSGSETSGYYVSAAVTPVDGTIVNPSVDNVWKIETNGGGRTIYNDVIQKYVGWQSGNGASVENAPANSNRWTFTYASDKFTVKNVAVVARQLSYNSGSPRFAAYEGAGQQELQLYKLTEGPICLTPTDLGATSLDLTSAELTWSSAGTEFEIEWGESGFTQGNGTVISGITTTSYILEDLTLDTPYEFYVRLVCDEETTSNWAGPYSFEVGYCAVSAEDSGDEWITNVTFAGINNTTVGINGLNDYTNQIATIEAGATESMSVTIDAYGSDYVSAFIDWNQNGNFDDSGEEYTIATNTASNGPHTINIEAPEDAAVGNTRLRVIIQWDGAPNPCGEVGYGEVEDYTVNVVGPITWIDGEWSNGTGPGINDDAVVEDALTITTSLSAKNLTVNEGASVIISEGGSLTLSGKLTNNASAENFIVESDANLIQNMDYTANDNQGGITVQRDSREIVRLDYTMWSSPVNAQQLQAFSPATLPGRIYTYESDAGIPTGAYIQVPSATSNFQNGKGYLFRAPNDWPYAETEPTGAAYEGGFIGTPFNGDVNVTVYPNGYTSVGNPYPSNIDPELVLAGNDIQALYFWNNPERIDNGDGTWGYSGTRYITFTGAGFSDPTYDGSSITVGQGFIVESTTSSVNFSNDMRITDEGTFFKNETERHRLWLDLSNDENQSYNKILVGYMEGATQGIDPQIDGKMFGYSGSALYNIITEEPFTIQGRALPFEASDIVTLGFKAAEEGKFNISLTNFDGLFAEGEVTVYLKDNLLNVNHNLMESAYTFESAAGEFKNRFEIVYEEEGTMGTGDMTAESVQIYKQNQNIVVNSRSEKILSVELFDLQGRNIHRNDKVNANIYQVKSVAKGVLVVRVQTRNGEIVTKKVINN